MEGTSKQARETSKKYTQQAKPGPWHCTSFALCPLTMLNGTSSQCFYWLVVWAHIPAFCISSGFVQRKPPKQRIKTYNKDLCQVPSTNYVVSDNCLKAKFNRVPRGNKYQLMVNSCRDTRVFVLFSDWITQIGNLTNARRFTKMDRHVFLSEHKQRFSRSTNEKLVLSDRFSRVRF